MKNEGQMDLEASFDDIDLEELATRLRTALDIRDRKYGFPSKTYSNCFVGREAVTQLVKDGIAVDEQNAVHIGNMMLNAGVFHHVVDAHPFKNEELFYRFFSDEDHGTVARKPDGSDVSWVDFMAPLTSAKEQTLTFQPKIPERDPDLASFEKVELEACGVSPALAFLEF